MVDLEKISDEEKREAFLILTKSEGWKILCAIAEIQASIRKNSVLYRPLESSDAVYQQEFMKGEIQGIENFMKLPQTILEAEALMNEEPKE